MKEIPSPVRKISSRLFTLAFRALAILTPAFLLSCEGEEEANGEVHIYLVESYDRIHEYGCGMVESTVVLEKDPLIFYEDLIYYDSEEYEFGLSENGMDAVGSIEHPVDGVPVAVVANGELIYTAYLWPGYSSMACSWITMDPLGAQFSGVLRVRPGYPGELENSVIEDRRNDLRILRIFDRDEKLRP